MFEGSKEKFIEESELFSSFSRHFSCFNSSSFSIVYVLSDYVV